MTSLMEKPPIPDWDTNRFDYWVVRYCRGISLITVFLVGMVLQVGFTRILPAFLTAALLILMIGHGITRFRYFPFQELKLAFSSDGLTKQTRMAVAFYSLFVIWLAVSSIWGFLPWYAMRDVLALSILLPLIYFLAVEQATNSNREFVLTLIAGILAASLLAILELKGITGILGMVSEKNALHDLNRCMILLALICWTPLLFIRFRPIDWILCSLCIVAAGIVVFSGQGEAAKLSYICALVAGVVLYFIPSLSRIIAVMLALTMLTFPLLLPYVAKPLENESIEFLKNGHARHRVAIWQGYNMRIAQKPIVGWGVRADRKLGKDGGITPLDPNKIYDENVSSPHNFIFEIWHNFGLIGAALIAGLILTLERALRQLPRDQFIVSCQIMVGAFTYMSTGSSFLQGWWLSTLAMALIAITVAYRQRLTS